MKTTPQETHIRPDKLIDITGEICPMTFVRTKLTLERMTKGDVLEVRLKGLEPLKNVPRSVIDQGDEILSLVAEEGEGATGVHRLLVRRLR